MLGLRGWIHFKSGRACQVIAFDFFKNYTWCFYPTDESWHMIYLHNCNSFGKKNSQVEGSKKGNSTNCCFSHIQLVVSPKLMHIHVAIIMVIFSKYTFFNFQNPQNCIMSGFYRISTPVKCEFHLKPNIFSQSTYIHLSSCISWAFTSFIVSLILIYNFCHFPKNSFK